MATCIGFSSLMRPKIKILVSGNAGDEKNLHPGGRRFVFLTNLSEFFK